MRNGLLALIVLGIGIGAGPVEDRGETFLEQVIPQPVHDFGPVQKGTMLRHAFQFKNCFGVPIQITSVRRGG